ncbi:MAG: HAD hydrolase-like protein [Oscillospiraceae bacterium]|nr:HAD hydrolase-like protein [Oscillospiraceae bacterium]
MAWYTHVVWDWNGTLLDDAAWNLRCIDAMLARRGLPVIGSLAAYREGFGFPVRDYYGELGFDFGREPFEALAAEYLGIYSDDRGGLGLRDGCVRALGGLRSRGVRQAVISASEIALLRAQIGSLGCAAYFDEILGKDDFHATGKLGLCMDYMARVRPGRALLVGDTLHDLEAAEAMGIDCVLMAGGHQSKERLIKGGAVVVDGFDGVTGLFA